MRIRWDAVFVSSVLFTIAFACLMPACWRSSRTEEEMMARTVGFTCLANIFVGLVVTWMGLIKRIRWSWFVMFIIVWVGAFPIMVLPILQHKRAITLSEWASRALREEGMPRYWAESVLIFTLMVIALILPIKSFFGKQSPAQTNGYPSHEQTK